MPDGRRGAFETVLVILAPNSQDLNPTQVIQQVVKVKTDIKVVFRDQKPKPKPSICYFDPNDKACDPDPRTGKCPPGSGFNDDDRCIPHGPCPSGYGRLDDDETGTCYPKKDIKRCEDGAIVHVREQCPPIVCPAGQELTPVGLGCQPIEPIEPIICPDGQQLSADGLRCDPIEPSPLICDVDNPPPECKGEEPIPGPPTECPDGQIVPPGEDCPEPPPVEGETPPLFSDNGSENVGEEDGDEEEDPGDEGVGSGDSDEGGGDEGGGDEGGGDEGGGDEGGGDEGGGDEGGGDEEAGADEE